MPNAPFSDGREGLPLCGRDSGRSPLDRKRGTALAPNVCVRWERLIFHFRLVEPVEKRVFKNCLPQRLERWDDASSDERQGKRTETSEFCGRHACVKTWLFYVH